MGRIKDLITKSSASAGTTRDLSWFSIERDKFPNGKRMYFLADPDVDDDWVVIERHYNPIPNVMPYKFDCEDPINKVDCQYCRQGVKMAFNLACVVFDLENNDVRLWEAPRTVVAALSKNQDHLGHKVTDSIFNVSLTGKQYSVDYMSGSERLTGAQDQLIQAAPNVQSLYPELKGS